MKTPAVASNEPLYSGLFAFSKLTMAATSRRQWSGTRPTIDDIANAQRLVDQVGHRHEAVPLIEAAGGKILLRAMELDSRREQRFCEIQAGRAETETLPFGSDEELVEI